MGGKKRKRVGKGRRSLEVWEGKGRWGKSTILEEKERNIYLLGTPGLNLRSGVWTSIWPVTSRQRKLIQILAIK